MGFSLPPLSYGWQLKGGKERLDVVQENTLSALSVAYSVYGAGDFGGGVDGDLEGELLAGGTRGAGEYGGYSDGGVGGDCCQSIRCYLLSVGFGTLYATS